LLTEIVLEQFQNKKIIVRKAEVDRILIFIENERRKKEVSRKNNRTTPKTQSKEN